MATPDKKIAVVATNKTGAEFTYTGKRMSGTIGPDVVDVRSLYKDHGLFTFDPGFMSTASCASGITFIDGDEGVLLYRGYPIEQLAEKSDYLEVCYLLLYGELPSKQELDTFTHTIKHHTMVHEQLRRFFDGFRRDRKSVV